MSNSDYFSPPHLHDHSSVRGMMTQVGLAMIPGVIFYWWFFGTGILVQCLLAVIFALALEWFIQRFVKKCITVYIDGSVVVTALLFAVAITPFTAWWINLAGIAFAVVVAKHVYGGLGYNLFNPAMAGYVFVLLCFPAQLNTWPSAEGAGDMVPALADYLGMIFNNTSIDAYSGASPLNHMKSQLNSMAMIPEITQDPLYGSFAGYGWEFINIGFLCGGIWLLVSRIINWHIPVAFLAGLTCMSMLFYMLDSNVAVSPLVNLFTGGTMLCAFFIATDPVTAPSSNLGRLVYGFSIGILAFVIRKWGAYPDGLAFAVLIANAFAPLINIYFNPEVLGEKTGDGN